MKQYQYTINGTQYDVTITGIMGSKAQVTVNGISFEVEMHGSTLTEGDLPTVTATEQAPATTSQPEPEVTATEKTNPGTGTPIKAPLPGVVTKILVKVGEKVTKGQTVLVLEAMKMENNITAEKDGAVTSICVAAGDSVMESTTLLTIE